MVVVLFPPVLMLFEEWEMLTVGLELEVRLTEIVINIR